MRKLFASVLAAAVVASLGSIAFAAEITVKGEVVDMQCSLKKGEGGRGEAHKGCATSCAKKGSPMAILTSDGKVYQIAGDYAANNNAKLVDLVATQVEAKGNVTQKDGQNVIEATSIAAVK